MNLWGVETLKGNKIGLKMDLQGITACARRGRPREASKGITKTTLTSVCGALPGLFDELLIATDEQLISR